MLSACPDALNRADHAVDAARKRDQQRAIAGSREYFFGLHPRERLQRLVDALPAAREFGL